MDLLQAPQRLDAFAAMTWTWAADFLPRLTMAVLILVVGLLFARWASRLVAGFAPGSQRLDDTIRPVLASVVRYAIVILVVVAALGQIGVQTASLLAVLGAAGLAIGLALQGTLSNISAGIMLLWLRPFRVDDYIEVPGASGVAGTVKEIGLFACIIETFDGITVFAPNSAIWNVAIRNHTARGVRLVAFSATLAPTAGAEAARATLLDIAGHDKRVLAQPAPLAYVESEAADKIVLTCRFWVTSHDLGAFQRDVLAEAARRLQALDAQADPLQSIVRIVPPDTDPSRLVGQGAAAA